MKAPLGPYWGVEHRWSKQANAFAVLFTTKGAPLLYYGDEVGLPGAGDPDNRRMMRNPSASDVVFPARTRASTGPVV